MLEGVTSISVMWRTNRIYKRSIGDIRFDRIPSPETHTTEIDVTVTPDQQLTSSATSPWTNLSAQENERECRDDLDVVEEPIGEDSVATLELFIQIFILNKLSDIVLFSSASCQNTKCASKWEKNKILSTN